MSLTVVVGPPCSGKSTFVRENAGEGDVIVDFDAMAQALGSASPHDAPKSIRSATFEARAAVIDHVLQSGTAAWLIHTAPSVPDVSRYREAGAEFTVLDPGMDECLDRAKERPDWTEQAIRDWYDNPPAIDAGAAPKERRTMKIKNANIQIKAGPDDGLKDGQFEAYASVFGNVDSYGDVVVKGAFADTIAEWNASENVLPALFGHRFDDPDFNIGHVEEASEDDHGLKVLIQLDLESPKAAQVYRLLKGRRISQMSYAYDVIEGGPAKDEGRGDYYELRKLKLHEVSVVPIGANQETEVLGVKALTDAIAAGLKEGRVLAVKHIDSLRSAQEAIGAVIEAASSGDDQEPKASGHTDPAPEASDEETHGSKSSADEQGRVNPSAPVLADLSILNAQYGRIGA